MPAKWAIITGLIISMLATGCGSRTGKSFVPAIPGYNEKERQVFVLDDALLEISGLSLISDDFLAAVNDEKGTLFFVDLKKDSLIQYKFKGKGDYEEVVKTDSAFYILESNGNILEVKPPYTESTEYKPRIKGKVEFESLVWYKELDKLVFITKEQRKRRQGITAFAFNLTTKQFDTQPFFEIALKDILVKLENYNAECKPSSAALNPVNNMLYIIASVGKVILECTPEGKLQRIFKINPTHFPQPEGITFANNGDMYISNEGLDGKATILKYPYVAQK